jgi:hypothetical protein
LAEAARAVIEACTTTDASLPDGFAARLLAVAQHERRRLERDLHDGAQQRLMALSIRLRLLATQLAPGSEQAQLLEDARQELADSLKELRDFARDVHPAILGDRGLRVGRWRVVCSGSWSCWLPCSPWAAAGRSPKDTDMHHNDTCSSPVIWDEQLPDQQDSGGRCA